MARLDICRPLWLKSVVLVLTVVFFQSVPVSAVVELSSDAGTEVCSGTEVTFTCTASIPTVRWRYSEAPEEDVLVDFTSGMALLRPFTLVPVTGDSTFVVSTATATITEGVNGSLSCEEQFNSTVIDGTTIPGIKGPFIPVPFVPESTIMSVGAKQWSFNLQWNVSQEDCTDTEYFITVDPPLSSVNCTVDCTPQCREFTLGEDDPHNFTVIAQNCGGTQNGTASEVPVVFELPDAPSVTTTLIYQKGNLSDPEELVTILLTWFPVPGPKDPAPGVDGSITGYQISVTGITPIDLPSSELSTEVDVPRDNITEYFVSVAARNVLGLGTASIIGPFNASNDYVTVNISATDCILVVECVRMDITSYTVSVTQEGTTPMISSKNCSSGPTLVLADPEVSSTTYEGEVQVNAGSVRVILIGSFEGNCTPMEVTTDVPDVCINLELEDDEIAWIVVGLILFVGAVILFVAAIVTHMEFYKRIMKRKDCHTVLLALEKGFSVCLHVASTVLWIVTAAKWSEDCREDVHKDIIQSSGGLSIGSFVWHIVWFLLPYLYRDCFLKCWRKYCCECCCNCCPEKDKTPGSDTTDGSKNKPDKMEMEEHYGHLQHNMGSPTSPAVPTQDPTYGQLNADDADESTGQQEYQQLRHGTQPHAVPNPEQPGYSHLGQPPPEGDQYAEVPKNDRRKWW